MNRYPVNPDLTQNILGLYTAVTTYPIGTQKPDNPPKVIRNVIPRNLDNPLKVIRNLVPKIIPVQWPIGLTVPTYIDINLSNQPLISTCQWHQYNYHYIFNILDKFSHGKNLPSSLPISRDEMAGATKNGEGVLSDFPTPILTNIGG